MQHRASAALSTEDMEMKWSRKQQENNPGKRERPDPDPLIKNNFLLNK